MIMCNIHFLELKSCSKEDEIVSYVNRYEGSLPLLIKSITYVMLSPLS